MERVVAAVPSGKMIVKFVVTISPTKTVKSLVSGTDVTTALDRLMASVVTDTVESEVRGRPGRTESICVGALRQSKVEVHVLQGEREIAAPRFSADGNGFNSQRTAPLVHPTGRIGAVIEPRRKRMIAQLASGISILDPDDP